MLASKNFSTLDQLILHVDQALQNVFGQTPTSLRESPAANFTDAPMSQEQKKQVAAYMRINHVGEVCAQALYQGQALTARSIVIKEKLKHAAQEEEDHLAWCKQRLDELGGHVSYLNPFWYGASLMIGLIAGLLGDKTSLGFLAETERQVEQHLTDHLQKIPAQDVKTHAILNQMRLDEAQHAVTAEEAGAIELPAFMKRVMQLLALAMKLTAYRI